MSSGNHLVNCLVYGFGDSCEPPLFMAFVCSMCIGFSDDASSTSNRSGFCLCSGHPAQTTGDECDARKVRFIIESKMQTCGIEQRDGRTVDDTLRPDVHVRTGRHLPVLSDSQGIHSFVVFLTRMVWNDHSICHDNTWCIGMRWKQSKRMTRIHDERLFLSHLTKILHGETVLGPILEY